MSERKGVKGEGRWLKASGRYNETRRTASTPLAKADKALQSDN
jgi:hypothetical protein